MKGLRQVLAVVWAVVALPAAACAPGRPTQLPPSDRCALQLSGDQHLFFAENVTYVDPSPLAWETTEPGKVGLDATRLQTAAVEAGLSGTVASLLVIRHGKLVFERYFNGSDASHANNVHSLSKSILSVLSGIAISEGLIEPDTPIANILPPDLIGANGDLTVRHLLTMSSGLDIEFERENDAIAIWESEKRSFVRAALESRRVAAPGDVFEYLNTLTQVLSAVIAEASGGSTCDFAYQRLFAALDIDVDHWHADPDGYHAGGHSMFLTPREIARFGQLVLQGGAWEGKQVVPAAWLAESLAATWDLGCRPERVRYGYLWWLHELDGHQVWTASGSGGQELHIVPDLDLVLVLTHATDGDPADFEVVPSLDLLRRYIFPAVAGAARQDGMSECTQQSHIVQIRPDGSRRTVILDATTSVVPWSWSPDGARIALHANRELNDEIYTMSIDGSDFRRLTRDFAADAMPAWSPDGTAIVFARGAPATSDLYRMDADGSNPTQLTDFEGYEHSPTWSPDGKSIAFVRGKGRNGVFGESGTLWVMGADGSDLRLLLDQPIGAPSWSPDERWIAFESRNGDATRIKVIDLDNGLVADLGPGTLPRWSPDGARLVFASDRTGNLDLFIMDADGGSLTQLTTGPEIDTLPSWSPDGKTILFVSFAAGTR